MTTRLDSSRGQASGTVASQTPLQALALKHNLWQKLTDYNEELRKKDDHMQMLLREELGNNFDAALTRILVEIHEVDFLTVLQARAIYDYIVEETYAASKYLMHRREYQGSGLHYGETFKVSIDSIDSAHVKLSQPFKDFQQQLEMFHDQPTEEKDNCAPPKATNQVAGHEVDYLKKYIFAPVFQSPECEMPDRVAARKANAKAYHDKRVNTSSTELGYESRRVEQELNHTTANIRKEEKRYMVFEYIRKERDTTGGYNSNRSLELEAIAAFNSCLDQLKRDASNSTELKVLRDDHQLHKAGKKFTVFGGYGNEVWMELCT
ncbi:hypothetical protein B5807_07664 [Epicoccum nigrum]|uniref:Uncharacterized protein n=1 Tax=Epicoccum nigrum TaxID=105696 RepID=A0A1Y2LWT5_EPING|nr:hypothetical protein B5807_07664 [Epicoccum nigrum]